MQTPRQLRFRSPDDITRLSSTIRAFIEHAIDLERSGAKVESKPLREMHIPEELQTELDAETALKEAFAGVPPGRQKGYIDQIAKPNKLLRGLPESLNVFHGYCLPKSSTTKLAAGLEQGYLETRFRHT